MKHEDNMKKQHETVAHLPGRGMRMLSPLARQKPEWPLPYQERKEADGFFTLRGKLVKP